MNLNKLILFFVVFLSQFVYCQSENDYRVKNIIKITEIEFSIPENNRFRLDKTHTLMKITFHLINDTCFVKKIFSDDKIVQINDEELLIFEPMKYDLKLDKNVFFNLIERIQNIDFENVEGDDFSIYDGFNYFLRFGNNNIIFNYQFYGLSHLKNKNAKEIFNLFEEIWKLYK